MSYGYVSTTARLSSFTGSGTLGYDLNGNLTSDGPRTYTYTPENQLSTVGPSVATYRYDGDNLRKVKVDQITGATRYYVHGPANQILSEFEEACAGNRQLARDYVYANGRLLAEVKPSVPPVQVGFALAGSSANEAAGTVTVGVRLTTASPTVCPVTVRFGTADGTAVAGTDYTATTSPPANPVVFGAGSGNGAIQNITIPLTNDTLCRGNRAFSVNLGETTGAAVIAGGGAHTVTIVDDDVTCVSGTKSFSGELTPDGGSVIYSITLANSGSQPQGDRPGNELSDTLSSDLTLLAASATAGSATISGNTVSWNGSIPASGSVGITINARTNLGTALRTIHNQATFAYDRNADGSNESSGATNMASFQVGTGRTNFYTVTPCRIVDTRNPAGPVGAPALSANAPRQFPITGYCGIPSTAKAVSLNVTIVFPTASGSVTLYPAFILPTGTNSISYSAGQVRANNAVLPLNAGQLSAVAGQAAGTVDLIIDVNGYFQ
jgi:hypothetical protein